MKNNYIVSIGSNNDAEQKTSEIRQILTNLFDNVAFSAFQWTPPVDAHYTQPFYNGAVCFECNLDAVDLKLQLKTIETKLGRTPEQKKEGIVPIDLDIIACNGEIIHTDYQRFPWVKEAVDSLWRLVKK
jgi:2-amino-4-hydroxy-6-hydroxymethyldihydropteridine diphosphokinase